VWEKDREALERAISMLASAAQGLPSDEESTST
jgi:hypothetical protein